MTALVSHVGDEVMREEDDVSERGWLNQVCAGEVSMSCCTSDKLPADLHANVVARLPISSIIRCKSVCRDWNLMILSRSFSYLQQEVPCKEKPWLFMCSSYNCRENCCAYDPNLKVWHTIPLTFIPFSLRIPLIAVGGLLFIKGANMDSTRQGTESSSCVAVCNPITRTWRMLPPMIRGRLNYLMGVFQDSVANNFKVVVAGGTSECSGDYECTTEVYDSISNSWCITGAVPREYTVKITVWTSKTVYCRGILYCLTCARPYNIMAYDMKNGVWEEVKIPQPELLFWSFLLVQRQGRLLLVGGAECELAGQTVHIWELQGEGEPNNWKRQYWLEVEQIPPHHFQRFGKGKAGLDLKCAGNGDMLYFFKDSHSKILLCDLLRRPATWSWLPTCPLSARFLNFSVRGLLVEPGLDAAPVIQP